MTEPNDPVHETPPAHPEDQPTPKVPEDKTLAYGDDSTVDPTSSVGEPFGEYELLREIARGGMGVVYLARQVRLNRLVALKMIRTGQLAGEEEVRRFQAEAAAAAQLDHPGIVPIYDVGDHEGQPYFSMAYVTGRSLADRVADGPLPPAEAAEFARQVARAIEYAHQRGIIHRDLKPANILLDEEGRTKVTDFGLAKQLQSESSARDMTVPGQILGTPSFMPPEQAAGQLDQIGPVSDIYALGAILYALLTGRPPFQAESPMATLKQVLEQEPISLRQWNPSLPKDLETICLKALEKAPKRRYSSAGELADELERYQRGEPIRARPLNAAARSWRWCKRRPAVAGLLALVVILLLSGTAVSGTLAYLAQQRADEAFRAQQEEKQQRLRAEENLYFAKDAVEKYLGIIGEDSELALRNFHDLRKRLFATAVPFYEAFVKQKPGDESIEQDRAGAYHRLARIHAEMGDPQRAVGYWQQAEESYAKLAKQHPDNTEYPIDRAAMLRNLAIHHMAHDLGKAESALDRAMTIYKSLAPRLQLVPHYLQDVSEAQNNLGLILKKRGDPQALDSFEEALRIQRKLRERFPNEVRFRRMLASTHLNLGSFHQEQRRFAQAEQSYRRGIDLYEQLLEAYPESPTYLRPLSRTYYNRGASYQSRAMYDEARQSYEKALQIQRRLTQELPRAPEYRQDLARTHNGLGVVFEMSKEFDEAHDSYRRALELQQRLVEDFPRVAKYRQEVAATWNNLGVLYKNQGEYDDGRRAYEEALALRKALVKELPDQPEAVLLLGGTYCNYGLLENSHSRWREALLWFDRGGVTLFPLVKKNPRDGRARHYLRAVYKGRAGAESPSPTRRSGPRLGERGQVDATLRRADRVPAVSIGGTRSSPQGRGRRSTRRGTWSEAQTGMGAVQRRLCVGSGFAAGRDVRASGDGGSRTNEEARLLPLGGTSASFTRGRGITSAATSRGLQAIRRDVGERLALTVSESGAPIGWRRNEDRESRQRFAVSTTSQPSSRSASGGPRPMCWTCDEFHRFGDLGLFEGRRAMLIDGVILEEGPTNPPHAVTLELVEHALRAAFGAGWRIRNQSPLVLGQDLDPESDFAVLAGSPRGSSGHPTTSDLVIEVAESSLDFDTTDKRLLYGRAGIPEYWVVDINGRRLLVYRDPSAGDYAVQQTLDETDSVSPLAFPSATLNVADFLE